MSAARLIEISENVWVDDAEVLAINAEQATGGTRIHLSSGDTVHTKATIGEVLRALGRTR